MFPGFNEIAERRRRLVAELVEGTAPARDEPDPGGGPDGHITVGRGPARGGSGAGDVRLSTLERYAAALGRTLDLTLR